MRNSFLQVHWQAYSPVRLKCLNTTPQLDQLEKPFTVHMPLRLGAPVPLSVVSVRLQTCMTR